MDWTWLGSLVYGLVSGLSEFLPISSDIHRALLRTLTGMPADMGVMRLAAHIGALLALLTVCRGRIGKLLREKRIASVPARRRKRQPDIPSLMELRLLKMAMIPLLLSSIAYPVLSQRMEKMWAMGLIVIGNGILVLLPQYRTRANKDARSLSALDALLTGIGGALGVLPGLSYITALTSVGQMRGMDRQFCVNFSCLLLLPLLLCLCAGDGWLLLTGSGVAAPWYCCVTACVSAFAAASAAIQLLRFLAVRAGFEAFAYYSWGIGMLSCILYLIG